MPVVPSTPALEPSGAIFSGLTALQAVTIPFFQWWLVVPEAPDLSIPLKRVVSSGGNSTIGTPSFTEDRPVPTAVYQAFERENAIVMHGKRQGARFDFSCTFFGEAEWAGMETLWNETMDNGYVVLVQSDQTMQWWADLGATRPASVLSTTDRQTNPIRVLDLVCVQVDEPA